MRLIQRTFKDVLVIEEVTWATMVFLPKRMGEYWGIKLMELVWKVCVAVINCQLTWSVILHDALYGFREGMVTGKSTLEEKLMQQLEGLVHKPLLQVF